MSKKKQKKIQELSNQVVVNLYPSHFVSEKRKKEKKKKKEKEYFSYCFVSFNDGGQWYSYIADTHNFRRGDYVIVPAGLGNDLTVVRVEAVGVVSAKKAPYPPGRTKHILRKYEGKDDRLRNFLRIGWFEELKEKERKQDLAEWREEDGDMILHSNVDNRDVLRIPKKVLNGETMDIELISEYGNDDEEDVDIDDEENEDFDDEEEDEEIAGGDEEK